MEDEFSELVDQLAAATPVVGGRQSTDLLTRRTTIEWHAQDVAVCASPLALRAQHNAAESGGILVIFATSQRSAAT